MRFLLFGLPVPFILLLWGATPMPEKKKPAEPTAATSSAAERPADSKS